MLNLNLQKAVLDMLYNYIYRKVGHVDPVPISTHCFAVTANINLPQPAKVLVKGKHIYISSFF